MSLPIRQAIQSPSSVGQPSPDPRLRGRDYARINGVQWVLLPFDLDKYGYPIQGTGWAWHKLTDQDRQWYQYIVWQARNRGYAWPSYATMAEERGVSIETAQRRMRRLDHCGFITKEHSFDTVAGDFSSNRYTPHNPLTPKGAAIAIVYRGKPVRTGHVQGEIPPAPRHDVRRGKPKTPHLPAGIDLPPLVILPHYYRQVAESEGLYDLVDQSQAWDAFLKARREGKIKRSGNPNAYFRGIIRKTVAQNRISAAEASAKVPQSRRGARQAALPIPALSPADEAANCRLWLQYEATALLAQGYDPGQTLDRLLRHPQLPRFTRLHAPSVEDVAGIVDSVATKAEELRQELERRRRPLSVSPDAMKWLRFQYDDLSRRKRNQREESLLGPVTGASIARSLAIFPGLPDELQGATPEQIEALLLKLEPGGT